MADPKPKPKPKPTPTPPGKPVGSNPPATPVKTVKAQKIFLTDPRRVRVPLNEFGSGTGILDLPRNEVVGVYDAPIHYTNPTVMAKNEITNTPEGSRLESKQRLLYLGGFYGSDAPLFGRRSPDDVAAMNAAMEAANLRGTTWRDESSARDAINRSLGVSSADSGSGGSGGNAPTSTLQITGPNQARAKLKDMYLKYTGKKPDDTVFSKFYDDLTNAQKKAPSRYEVKVINGKAYNVQVTDGIDVDSFTEQYVFNKINFTGGDLQGISGENFTATGKLADMYDISLSTAEKARYAKALTLGDSSENDIREELSKRAKIKFPGLSDRIDSTVTTKDLLNEHLQAYANTLEIPLANVKLSDVSGKAFRDNKLVSSNDMIESLKNDDPRYRNTRAAKTNAASFAIGLARTLGFGA